jgi:hypothetical protein
MKKFFLMFNILALLALTACQGGSSGGKGGPVGGPAKPAGGGNSGTDYGGGGMPVPPTSDNGGIDLAGGGNTLNGKDLAEYIKNLNDIPAYQKVHDRVLSKLVVSFPEFAGELMYIANARPWYFLPAALPKLPERLIGTVFPTDQAALQFPRKIWMDSELFDKMAPTSQEFLVLHELLMGVRILEIADPRDQCLAKANKYSLSPDAASTFSAARKECVEKFKLQTILDDVVGTGKKLKLSDGDYDTIRSLTAQLYNNIDTLNIEDLKEWMAYYGYRKY